MSDSFMRPDTLRLLLGHYCLLPLIWLLAIIRHFHHFDFTVGWVYTDNGKTRYTTFGPIRLVKR